MIPGGVNLSSPAVSKAGLVFLQMHQQSEICSVVEPTASCLKRFVLKVCHISLSCESRTKSVFKIRLACLCFNPM